VNPQTASQYLPILGTDESLADAPQVLEGFYNTCALAGPSVCPIAAQYPTAEGIKNAMNEFLNKTYTEWNSGGGIESYNTFVNSDLYNYLVMPDKWDKVAELLATRFNGTMNGATPSADMGVHSTGFSWIGNYSAVAITYVFSTLPPLITFYYRFRLLFFMQ
jgi:hypothetical protein